MHNGFTNEMTFTHMKFFFELHPLRPIQVVEDQVQIKSKRKEEKIKKNKAKKSPHTCKPMK